VSESVVDGGRRAFSAHGGHFERTQIQVGQTVHFTSGAYGRGGAGGIYKITQLLPPEGDDSQYRIKSANEPHERGRQGKPAQPRVLTSAAGRRSRARR